MSFDDRTLFIICGFYNSNFNSQFFYMQYEMNARIYSAYMYYTRCMGLCHGMWFHIEAFRFYVTQLYDLYLLYTGSEMKIY
jgi:hypothetical protein